MLQREAACRAAGELRSLSVLLLWGESCRVHALDLASRTAPPAQLPAPTRRPGPPPHGCPLAAALTRGPPP
jgi:hypothetical protein